MSSNVCRSRNSHCVAGVHRDVRDAWRLSVPSPRRGPWGPQPRSWSERTAPTGDTDITDSHAASRGGQLRWWIRSNIPSSFLELYGAASEVAGQEPGLSPAPTCVWTGTPGKPVPGLVWPPPSAGYAPFVWRCPEAESKRSFEQRATRDETSHFIHSNSGPLVLRSLTPFLSRASVSQSVMSSRMSAARPQLHMQSNSCPYCVGAAPESIFLSLDRTPQLGAGWERRLRGQNKRGERGREAAGCATAYLNVGTEAGGINEASCMRGTVHRSSWTNKQETLTVKLVNSWKKTFKVQK